jgi:nicotinamide riboside kinase
MQRTIMEAQLEREQVARSVAGSSAVRVVLSDRSAVDPIAYAVLTAATEDEARARMRVLVDTSEFQAALRRYREGMFILFKPVPEWLVDDGVRSTDKQGQSSEVFPEVLKELGIPYVELGEEIKDLQARVAFAKRLIGQVVRACFFLLQNRVNILISSSL